MFRSDIEGLRGIAVLLIAAFHAGVPGFGGGFTGVDVFFVLSGYLITRVLVDEIVTSARIDLARFYARRARRLLPALAVMMAVVTAAALVLLPPLEQKSLSETALATAAYCSNFLFMRQGADYFAPEARANPLLHTWSLGVEEQFYLIWPLLTLLGCTGRRPRRNLVTLLTGGVVLSFAAWVWLTYRNPPWGFYGSPARAWEFGVGGVASLIPGKWLVARGGLIRLLGWLGLAALAGACAGFSSAFPRAALLVSVLGTAAILSAGAARAVGSGGGVAKVLNVPALRSLGKYSYSWYLWHWPLLTLAEARLGSLPLSGRVLCVTAALGLAVPAQRWIENPIRFHPRLVARTALSLGLAALLTLGGIGISAVWSLAVKRTQQYKVFAQPLRDVPRFYELGCTAPFLDARLRECVFGDANSSTTVVLLGDSHAAQWFPALERIANQNGWRLVTMIKTACPAASIRVFQTKLGREEQQCTLWRDAAIKRTLALDARAVIMASSTEYLRVSPEEWREGTRKMAETFSSSSVETIFMRDTPNAPFEVPRCLARAAWRGSGDCSLMRSQALEETVYGIEQEVARSLPQVWNVDLSDQICGPARCETVQSGKIIFRDRDHLTASYVESLAPALAARIVPLVSGKSGQSATNPRHGVSHIFGSELQ